MGDVVHCLPGHSPGESAIPDDGDDVTVPLSLDMKGAGNPVGPADRTGRVRALNNVVFGLGALRVASESALLTKLGKVTAAGQHLVHIRLVTGIPHHRVTRRVEHPMQGDGEFNHTQVGTEVTT